MITDALIREIVSDAIAEGAPNAVAMKLEAMLFNAKFQHEAAMRRVNRHRDVLDAVTKCAGNVALAAERLQLTPRAVYLHLEEEAEKKLKREPATASQEA